MELAFTIPLDGNIAIRALEHPTEPDQVVFEVIRDNHKIAAASSRKDDLRRMTDMLAPPEHGPHSGAFGMRLPQSRTEKPASIGEIARDLQQPAA